MSSVSHPDGFLQVTPSVCPTCRAVVPAKVLFKTGNVHLETCCPEHGTTNTVISNDIDAFLATRNFFSQAWMPMGFAQSYAHNCPDNCGLCPEHEQHVCMPVVEITDHCDLTCPVCLVKNRNSWHMTRDEFNGILDRLLETEGLIDVLSFSGGEPTLHPEFRTLVTDALARRKILRVSVSTNGRRLARDPELLRFLAQNNVVISLQFDSFNAEAVTTLRGADLTAEKRTIIADLVALDAALSLTYTLAGGVNETGLKEAVDLLFQHPNILSIMVQPMTFCGAGKGFAPKRRVFIPEVTELLEKHGGGRLQKHDFMPLPCSHPNCFSLGFFLKLDDGEYTPLRRLFDVDTYKDLIQNRTLIGTDPDSFQDIQNAVYQLWTGGNATTPDSHKALGAIRNLIRNMQSTGTFDPTRNVALAERSMKSIFIHAFMDEETFDLSRARKCCQVYPLRDGRFMPICVYNTHYR
jgi:hypothetical protein